MKQVKVLVSVIVVAAGFSSPMTAQEAQDTTRLEDVTITATRIPVSANALASSITVLQGADLQAQGIRNVLDALRTVPGLSIVQTGSFGGATSLFLRGGESDYVQVLVDGVPVNSPGGSYNFANLTTTNVERIEVLRGPASVLYGSDATVGVVQIITKRGKGPFRVSAAANAGTYGSVGFDVDVSGATDRTRYSLGIERFFTNGSYDFNNDFDNTVVSGRFDVRPNDATDLSVTLRYQDSEFHFPTNFFGALEDRNAFSLDEATTIGVDAGRFLTKNVEARVLLASNVVSRGTNDAQDDPSDTLGFSYASRSIQDLSRQSIDARTNVYLDNGIVLTAGAQLEQQEERSFYESESAGGPSNSSTDAERSNQAYYAQFLADIEGVSAIVGGRLDHNEEFGTFATYRAAAAYTAAGTKLRASVGRSFKAPLFFENVPTAFGAGNPDLVPERSFSWEFGLEKRLFDGRLAVGAAYFDQTFKDLIQYSFTEFNYENIAEATASGVEIEARVAPIRDFVIGANYTYLDTEVIDAFDSGAGATFVKGQRLLRRPSNTLNLTAMYRGWDRGVISAVVNYVGDRDDRDFATFTPVVLPAYTTVDLAAQIELLPQRTDMGLTWTLRVENVFDRKYVAVFGFPARGRTIFVGGRVSR